MMTMGTNEALSPSFISLNDCFYWLYRWYAPVDSVDSVEAGVRVRACIVVSFHYQNCIESYVALHTTEQNPNDEHSLPPQSGKWMYRMFTSSLP
jgi:hypothetical protein